MTLLSLMMGWLFPVSPTPRRRWMRPLISRLQVGNALASGEPADTSIVFDIDVNQRSGKGIYAQFGSSMRRYPSTIENFTIKKLELATAFSEYPGAPGARLHAVGYMLRF